MIESISISNVATYGATPVQDGSHYAHDDLYVTIDTLQIENYLRVFRNIFEKTKHTSHYEMMMGTALTGS